MSTILCAVDLSDASRNAFLTATSLARRMGAKMVLTHVSVFEQGEESGTDDAQDLTHWAEEARADDVEVTVDLRTGAAGRAIVKAANEHEADIVVVGSHGQAGLVRALLGSVAEYVVGHAKRPVLVVPGDGDSA